MTTTFKDLVDETSSELHGLTADLEQVTFLTSDVTSGASQLQVDDASQISRGLIEIGDELMWVTKVDTTNNNVTIAPFGRGYRDSTAASHTANTQITDNPRFPRVAIKQKINQALSECYPEVFAIKTDESNTANPVVTTYPVPSDADAILNIRYKLIGPSGLWEPLRRYTFNSTADTTAYPTGKSVDIGDGMFPGQPIRITYIAKPGVLVNDADTLTTIGLDDNMRDVLIYGAAYRLTAGLEIARLQTTTVEQSERATYVPAGAATAGSKFYLAIFQERLQNERQRLLQANPSTTHMSR